MAFPVDFGYPAAMTPIGEYFSDSHPPQSPADVAVVMTTLARDCITRALDSVYAQAFADRIQLVIGIDVVEGDLDALRRTLEARPANVSAVLLQLPYSTSARHGGVHTPGDGGALRAILSLVANSRRVAYLDDDNTWTPDHLRLLSEAIGDRAWAYAQRMLVDVETDRDLGVDVWHSAGPNLGEFSAEGGFVDTNCLLVDKVQAATRLANWSDTLDGAPRDSADRRFFLSIAKLPHSRVEPATVRYRIRRGNRLHVSLIEAQGRRAVGIPL